MNEPVSKTDELPVTAGSECSAGLGACCFVDGKLTDDPYPTAEQCTCGGNLEFEYGFCRHGLGVFERCVDCGTVFNFHKDTGG